MNRRGGSRASATWAAIGAVAVWLAVVALGSTLVWLAISRAGDDVVGGTGTGPSVSRSRVIQIPASDRHHLRLESDAVNRLTFAASSSASLGPH